MNKVGSVTNSHYFRFCKSTRSGGEEKGEKERVERGDNMTGIFGLNDSQKTTTVGHSSPVPTSISMVLCVLSWCCVLIRRGLQSSRLQLFGREHGRRVADAEW